MRNHWAAWILGGTLAGAAGAALLLTAFGVLGVLSAPEAHLDVGLDTEALLGFAAWGAAGGGTSGLICAAATYFERHESDGRRVFSACAAAITGSLVTLPGVSLVLLAVSPRPVGAAASPLWAAGAAVALVVPPPVAAWFLGGWIWRWTRRASQRSRRSGRV